MSAPITIDALVEKMRPVFEKQTIELVAAANEKAAQAAAAREAVQLAEIETLKASGSSMREAVERMAKAAEKAGKPDPHSKPGMKAAQYIRCIAAAKGDIERAAGFSKKMFGEDSEVTKALIEKAGLTTGVLSEGGALVPETFSTDLIDLLRPKSVIRSNGPTVYPMANGVLTVPKLVSGSTATYIGEATAQNATKPGYGQLRLVWKKLRALVPASNELLRFSSPAADQTILQDLSRGMSTAADVAFIRGTGVSDAPRGLRYWAPAANVTASAAANDASVPTLVEVETDLRTMLNALESADVAMERPLWLLSPRSKNFLMTIRDTNGFIAFPEIRSGNLWGFTLGTTNNVPSNLGAGTDPESELYLVDMIDAVVGEATQIEVDISNEASYTDDTGTVRSAFDRDETVIRTIERHDFGMRHDASVVVKTGIVYGAR